MYKRDGKFSLRFLRYILGGIAINWPGDESQEVVPAYGRPSRFSSC